MRPQCQLVGAREEVAIAQSDHALDGEGVLQRAKQSELAILVDLLVQIGEMLGRVTRTQFGVNEFSSFEGRVQALRKFFVVVGEGRIPRFFLPLHQLRG